MANTAEEEKNGNRKKDKGVQRVRPWEEGMECWSAWAQNTHTHTPCVQLYCCTRMCTHTHAALHQAIYLLMRLFKNAVGGRALNHPSAPVKGSHGARCTEGRKERKREREECGERGERKSLSVKRR